MLFLYEGDSYYDLSDWTKFESRVAAVPELKVVKLSRIEVMKICPRRCDRDSHGAVWGDGFEGAHTRQSACSKFLHPWGGAA